MKNLEKKNAQNPAFTARELIKPQNANANQVELESLCVEFGNGTDCRAGNASIDPNEDSLLF